MDFLVSPASITGGLASDEGLVEALREKIAAEELPMKIHTHESSIHAGALGAALFAWHQIMRRCSQSFFDLPEC